MNYICHIKRTIVILFGFVISVVTFKHNIIPNIQIINDVEVELKNVLLMALKCMFGCGWKIPQGLVRDIIQYFSTPLNLGVAENISRVRLTEIRNDLLPEPSNNA